MGRSFRDSQGLSARWLLLLVCLSAGCSSPPDPLPRDLPPPSPAIEPTVRACRDAGPLPPPGEALAADLAGEECHEYRLTLAAGDLLRLTVEQRQVDLWVSLVEPAGGVVLEVDVPTGTFGRELLLAVARQDGEHRLAVRAFPQPEAGRYILQREALRPAAPAERELAAAYRRALEVQGTPQQLQAWSEVAAFAEAQGAHRLGGEAWFLFAWLHSLDDPVRAESLRRAAHFFGRANEPGWQALAEQNLCAALIFRSRAEEALAACERADLLGDHADDLTRAGIAHGAGRAHRMLGELQPALDQLEEALALWPAEETDNRPITLTEIGILQARFLGDGAAGARHLRDALGALEPLAGDARWNATARSALSQLGRLAYENGDLDEARSYFERSLGLTGESCQRATVLARLALVKARQGREDEASRHAAEAAALVKGGPCGRFAGTVLLLAGELAEYRGDWNAARDAFRRAQQHFETRKDPSGAAESLAGVAKAERALGSPLAALEAAQQAMARIEGVRPTVLRLDLRTSFSTSMQETYDLVIDLLLDLDRPAEAWAMAERTRARGLRDLLVESGVGLRRDANPAWIERERSLRRHLNDLESRRIAPDKAPSEAQLSALREEIAEALSDLERIRGELRRENADYADLIAATPLSSQDLQRLIAPNVTLLEVHLAEEASALWVVTAETLRAHRLPPRGEIEPLAEEVAAWMRRTGGSGRPPPTACRLSSAVLGAIPPKELTPRLVFVADGALETVSFAALPRPHFDGPCAEAPPLIASHQVSYLPSAAVLAHVRDRRKESSPTQFWLAVVADPIYGRDDSRLASRAPAPENDAAGAWRRLAYTGEEAEALANRFPADRVTLLTGASASRRAVRQGALRGHRLVHFATHGVLDPLHPLLSRLVLSHWNEDGQQIESDLRAHEIYDLDLPAELVVLSACDTGRGPSVRGEGLQAGLPRAFLYAGAERVMVSLWPVRDRDTGRLMERFYDGLLERGLPPARALKEAQLEAWRDGLPPSAWAGFLLYGETEPLPPFP